MVTLGNQVVEILGRRPLKHSFADGSLNFIVVEERLESLVVDILPHPYNSAPFEFHEEDPVVVVFPAVLSCDIFPPDTPELPVYYDLFDVELYSLRESLFPQLVDLLSGVVYTREACRSQESVAGLVVDHPVEELRISCVECLDEICNGTFLCFVGIVCHAYSRLDCLYKYSKVVRDQLTSFKS